MAASRLCAEAGCPNRIPGGSGPSRCSGHQRQRDQQRGTTSQRGYGREHQALRAHLVATYQPTDPDPARLDLGHTDDRQAWEGLVHDVCNRGNRRG